MASYLNKMPTSQRMTFVTKKRYHNSQGWQLRINLYMMNSITCIYLKHRVFCENGIPQNKLIAQETIFVA